MLSVLGHMRTPLVGASTAVNHLGSIWPSVKKALNPANGDPVPRRQQSGVQISTRVEKPMSVTGIGIMKPYQGIFLNYEDQR